MEASGLEYFQKMKNFMVYKTQLLHPDSEGFMTNRFNNGCGRKFNFTHLDILFMMRTVLKKKVAGTF